MRTKPRAPSHRPLGPRHDEVGLAGEDAFSARYGYPVDERRLRHGDGGIDFWTLLGGVDVKTHRRPGHLLVEAGKEDRAAVYVLARYDEATGRAELIGWATREEVEAAPVSDVGRMGVLSRAVPARALHEMAQLDEMLGAWCPGCGVRVVGNVERFPMRSGSRPADCAAVCEPCGGVGWKLAKEQRR